LKIVTFTGNNQEEVLTTEEFRTLFEKYFDEIRRYIYYRGGDADLAEDIAQQTFLKVWEKQQIILPGQQRALLYKIAGDEFVTHFRKTKVEEAFRNNFTLHLTSAPPDEEMEYRETAEKYEKALKQMKENQRVVFLMSRKEELKYHEIAARLNISQKAVEKRMKGALEILKKELKTG
jgi:RNA polymerase sigma factor (sigma-70 family)